MGTERIGWIGTGIMGVPMAEHLLRAGHSVTVYTRTRSKAEGLLAQGAQWAETPAACAREAGIVVSIVTDSPDVERVFLDAGGVCETIRSGALAIDMSTIAPAVARRIGEALRARGVDFLDAPVSGGSWGAQQGTLSIMVGGESTAVERARLVLAAFGKTITHCGPIGAGQATKLCNQILCAVHLVGACEAIVFAKKNGLDAAKMLEAVGGGAAGSWVISNLAPRMLQHDFAPGFRVDLQQKDLRLVFETAEEHDIALPGVALAQQLLRAAQALGHGKDGTQAMIEVFKQLNGVQHVD